MDDDFTDTTAVTDTGDTVDVLAELAADASGVTSTYLATAVIPPAEPVLRNLKWIDIQNEEPVSRAPGWYLNIALQERAGLFWKIASRQELSKLGVSAQEPIIQTVEVRRFGDDQIVMGGFRIISYGEDAYMAVWDGRAFDGFYIEPESYYFRVELRVGIYVDEALSEPLEVKGDAYTVYMIYTPKNDEEIENAIRQAIPRSPVGINANGERIMRDSWLEVYRGGTLGSSDSEPVTHRIEAHLESTWWGYFSTPKRRYKGCYGYHGSSRFGQHSSVEFGDRVGNDLARTTWGHFRVLKTVLRNQPTVDVNTAQPRQQLNPLPGNPYKIFVEVHKGDEYWTNTGVSQGCVTHSVPIHGPPGSNYRNNRAYPVTANDPPYGKGLLEHQFTSRARIRHDFGAFHNRQTSTDYLSENSNDLLASIYGGFSAREICERLKIWVDLHRPLPGSAYERLHRYPVALWDDECFIEPMGLIIFTCRFHTANSVLRQLSTGEDLVVRVDANSIEFEPFIRYTSGAEPSGTGLILDHKLDPNHFIHKVNNNQYELGILYDRLDQLLKTAIMANKASILLKVDFAWNWTGLPAAYPYAPPVDVSGRRMDSNFTGPGQVSAEFVFEIPPPSPTNV